MIQVHHIYYVSADLTGGEAQAGMRAVGSERGKGCVSAARSERVKAHVMHGSEDGLWKELFAA